MKNINLIIAAWGGERKNEKPEYLNLTPCGTVNHIAKQISTLNRYAHQLSQVTIVCPPCSSPNPEYSDAIRHLPTHLNNGTKIELLHSDRNVDSYFSYSYAIRRYKDAFDYYICIEDDYVFVENNFDSIMVDMYEEVSWACNYLVSYVKGNAIITNGIVSSKVLRGKNYFLGDRMHTFLTSFVFGAFRREYGLSPYFCSKGIMYFGSGKYLLAPTQMVNDSGTVVTPNHILYYEEIIKGMPSDEVLKFLATLH